MKKDNQLFSTNKLDLTQQQWPQASQQEQWEQQQLAILVKTNLEKYKDHNTENYILTNIISQKERQLQLDNKSIKHQNYVEHLVGLYLDVVAC